MASSMVHSPAPSLYWTLYVATGVSGSSGGSQLTTHPWAIFSMLTLRGTPVAGPEGVRAPEGPDCASEGSSDWAGWAGGGPDSGSATVDCCCSPLLVAEEVSAEPEEVSGDFFAASKVDWKKRKKKKKEVKWGTSFLSLNVTEKTVKCRRQSNDDDHRRRYPVPIYNCKFHYRRTLLAILWLLCGNRECYAFKC